MGKNGFGTIFMKKRAFASEMPALNPKYYSSLSRRFRIISMGKTQYNIGNRSLNKFSSEMIFAIVKLPNAQSPDNAGHVSNLTDTDYGKLCGLSIHSHIH